MDRGKYGLSVVINYKAVNQVKLINQRFHTIYPVILCPIELELIAQLFIFPNRSKVLYLSILAPQRLSMVVSLVKELSTPSRNRAASFHLEPHHSLL